MGAPVSRGAEQDNSTEVTANDGRNAALRTATNQPLGPLTRVDLNALKLYECIIGQGLKTFLKVGNALTLIRDARLYRESHATFENYCRGRWDISKTRAYELIGAAAVTQNLSAIADILPATESQARPLTALEPEAQREAWASAVESAPIDATGARKVTAAQRHQ